MNSGCFTSEFAKHMTNKYCLCLSTYVSAFGFVGFILFPICKSTKVTVVYLMYLTNKPGRMKERDFAVMTAMCLDSTGQSDGGDNVTK